MRITLDNGEKIECTLNHRFMLRNGEYLEAQDLIPGDSLMPLYKEAELINHKVVSIEYISDRADVYDIEVADNHNFALACGVFVHNSKDISDAVCGAIYTASQHAEDFAYNYGESLEELLQVNSSENDENLSLNLEEELKRLNNIFGKNNIPTFNKKEEENNFYFDDIVIL